MSTGKHTPGPWHRNIKPASKYPTVWAGRNTHVASLLGHRDGGNNRLSEEELEANIDLIATAPELLTALKTLLKANDDVQTALADGPDVPGWDRSALPKAQAAVTEAERAALAVINKAEGQS